MVVFRKVSGLAQVALSVYLTDRALKDIAADRGMFLHDLELFGSQLSGLIEDRIGNTDLAQIVQRRGLDNIRNKCIRQLVEIITLSLQAFHDQAYIARGTLDMVACIVIAIFDHIREDYDQTALHAGYRLRLLSDVLLTGYRINCHLPERAVQVLYLVSGAYLQAVDTASFIINASVSIVGNEFVRAVRHTVYGKYQTVSRYADTGRKHNSEQRSRDQDNPDRE